MPACRCHCDRLHTKVAEISYVVGMKNPCLRSHPSSRPFCIHFLFGWKYPRDFAVEFRTSRAMSLPYPKHSSRLLPCVRRAYSTTGCDQPIIYIPPGSHVYAFGSASQSSTPLIQDFDWTVRDGEAWAIISGTGREKTSIFKGSIFN